MTIARKGKNLVITFGYDAYIVSLVGSIPGRAYDKKTHEWKVPVSQIEDVVVKLYPLGFTVTEEVKLMYQTELQRRAKVNRIRSGDLKESELSLLDLTGFPFYMYQKVGTGFIAVVDSGLVGDQPGLGKTIQSLGATVVKNAKKVLIFCPVSMKKTWQEEIEKWIPGATSTIVGGDVKARAKQWEQDTTYYICNYHLLLRDVKTMKKFDWDFIIADEATTISNPKSKTSAALKSIPAKRRIALTGTPLNNSVQDIWNIVDWLRPGYLGTYWQFIKEYCTQDKFGSITGYKNLQKLKDKLESLMIRRLKKDVLHELPPKTFENVYVELSPEERKLYTAIKQELAGELKESGMDGKNLSKTLVKMVRLKQAACSLELLNGVQASAKTDALKELLTNILWDDEKTIIFTQFREMALLLMRDLAQYKPLLIAGGVTQDERDANRKAFNEDNEHKILIMTAAGGMGLNLQRASSVIHYDFPWSISALEQREDRAHRNGQTKNVVIYNMIVQDSIDEYILKVLYKKKKVSEEVLGDNDKDAAKVVKLSRRDIQKILS